MRVLITGIEGFAGRHLARKLLEEGHKVVGTVQRRAATKYLKRELGWLQLAEADLRHSRAIEGPVVSATPDCIVHLAAQSSGALSMRDPALTYRTNVLGTLNLLDTLRFLAWNGRVLIVSSADVYGSSKNHALFREEDPLLHPNHYASSKAMAELLAKQYHSLHGLRTIRARPFPHTGPGQSRQFAVSSFAKQIAEAEKQGGGKVKVGNLDVVRDYLDVRDAAAAYLAILENGKDGAVYNIARGEPRRLGEVLEMLLAKSRVPVEVEADTTRRRPFDIDYQAGDAGKLMKDTGWKPLIPLDRTLEDLLQYWREAGREKARGARKRVDNI